MSPSVARSSLAEAVGALALIFLGAGSIIADQMSGGKLGLTGIALAHGLAIAAMVAAAGHVSGGHFNPAVTLGFVATGRMPIGTGITYMLAQLVGASVGSLLLTAVFPEAARIAVNLGTPALGPGVSAGTGIVVEAVLTFFLVFVIFGVAVDTRGERAIAPLAIGLVIVTDILGAGVLTGAAMNPARAFGPALFSGFWTNHAVFWFGPFIGGVLGAWAHTYLMARPAA